LSVAGFLFPLYQPVLGMRGQPASWEQSSEGSGIARSDGLNSTQHVSQVRPYVNAVPTDARSAREGLRSPALTRTILADQDHDHEYMRSVDLMPMCTDE
jgi:hypothetical protein